MEKQVIANFLKQLRRTSGLSANEVTDKLQEYDIDISAKTLYGYESGLRMLNADAFVALCRIYKCDNPLEIFGTPAIKSNEFDIIEKYRFVSIHSPEGASVVNTVLDREYAIAEKLKAQEDAKDRTASPSAAEIIPMRFLSYYQRMASAGKGEFLFPDIPTEVIAVPDTPLSRRADFVIGVSGRSMEDTFFDGDKVLVEKADEVPIGKIGIFVRGNECFIKEAGQNRLISHNGDKEQYPDIVPDERGIDAIGIVLGKVGE